MKRWQFVVILGVLVLLAGVKPRVENSRRFQNVKHALQNSSGDLPAFNRVLVGLLA